MILIYNVIYFFVFILIIPFFLFKMLFSGKYRAGLFQRFSLYPRTIKKALKEKKCIWVHAVSVGEVLSVVPLIERLRVTYADHNVVLSVVTNSGYAIAKSKLGDSVIHLYFPLDFYFVMRRTIKLLHPSLVLFIEADLWPNLLRLLYRRNIPAIIINGRISQKSYKQYRLFSGFFRKLLSGIDLITVQSAQDRQRFIGIGAKPPRIKIIENLKWEDYLYKMITDLDREALRKTLHLQSTDLVLVAGSTHTKEEKVLLQIFSSLKSRYPQLKLIIAPRHPERFGKVKKILRESGLPFSNWSEIKPLNPQDSIADIILIDTIGELNKIYSIATIAFVGKSLFKKGGQNIIEPARLSRPVVFGPHMENFEYITSLFIQGSGARQVTSEEELEHAFNDLLAHPEERDRMGKAARQVVDKNSGGLERNFVLIKEIYRPLVK